MDASRLARALWGGGYAPENDAISYGRQTDRAAARDELVKALSGTWPAQMAKSAVGAAALPGDVYAGRVDPMSQQGIERAADLTGLMTLGSFGFQRPMGSIGMGGRDDIVKQVPHASTMNNEKPITFYHGANERYNQILTDQKDPGAWFTTDLQNAANYARGDDAWVHSVNLTPKNPMVVVFDYDQAGKIFATHDGRPLPHSSNVDIVKYAKENGFDSVHFPRGNFTEADNTYVVFNPNDIKIID
jgi:hypothetical protein